jgi:hypothetical protein
MRTFSKALVGLVAAGALSLSLAACGGSSSGSGDSSSTTPKLVAEVKTLTGKSTSVALDAGFLSALTTLKLTPGVVGTATLTGTTISFPITGGNVKYYQPGTVKPYVQGSISHSGSGLSLTAGTGATAIKVELTNFTIDPGVSKLYGDVTANGTSAAKQAFLFDLDGSTLQPLKTEVDGAGTATLQGTTVKISPDAAALLNKTFSTTAVTPELVVGIAKIVINTK